MTISTVITTYNRAGCVGRAVRSVLSTFPGTEIVVVDDASSDDTIAQLRNDFAREIAAGTLTLVCLRYNVGVSGAKNAGFQHATGDWVIFLDSDDEYYPGAGSAMTEELHYASKRPIVFFRCLDEIGNFVGTREGERLDLGLSAYLIHTSFGEALTAINKVVVGPSAPYPQELRGYEGLGCARLIERFGPALLSPLIGRIFYQQGTDRLSVAQGFIGRMPLLARGHWTMVREFGAHMSWRSAAALLIKAVVYRVIGSAYAVWKWQAR